MTKRISTSDLATLIVEGNKNLTAAILALANNLGNMQQPKAAEVGTVKTTTPKSATKQTTNWLDYRIKNATAYAKANGLEMGVWAIHRANKPVFYGAYTTAKKPVNAHRKNEFLVGVVSANGVYTTAA